MNPGQLWGSILSLTQLFQPSVLHHRFHPRHLHPQQFPWPQTSPEKEEPSPPIAQSPPSSSSRRCWTGFCLPALTCWGPGHPPSLIPTVHVTCLSLSPRSFPAGCKCALVSPTIKRGPSICPTSLSLWPFSETTHSKRSHSARLWGSPGTVYGC